MGSNLAGVMDDCLLGVLCVFRQSAVCLGVMVKPRSGGHGPLGAVAPWAKKLVFIVREMRHTQTH